MKIAFVVLVLIVGPSEASAAVAAEEALALYREEQFADAFDALSPLAEAGNAEAQFVLGLMYANGQGVEQNYYLAGKMYRLAATQGHSGAQTNLGSLYEECYGTGPCNAEQAANWYRRAAEQDNVIAQYNLGVLYATGKGVAKDPWTAKVLFRQASEAGYTPAQYNLAVSYENGLGGPIDLSAAYAWYDLAASRGYPAAEVRRARLTEIFDPVQRTGAQSHAARIRESYGDRSNITY